MYEVKFTLSGMKEIQSKLARLDNQQIPEFCQQLCDKYAGLILEEAKENTAVRTGKLKSSWGVQKFHSKSQSKNVVFNTADYAIYVELGHKTRNHKSWVEGQHMLSNATTLIQTKSEQIADNLLKTFIGDF